jgi:uncharacterized membrane protein
MRLTPTEEQDVVRAIANAERGNRGEVRLHLEARCRGEPLARAEALYRELGMHQTRDDTGVLLYVATASRVCAVFCGAGIVSRPPEGFWKSVTDAVAQGFEAKAPARGLVDGLKRIGDVLREHVPGEDRAGDELQNTISTGPGAQA